VGIDDGAAVASVAGDVDLGDPLGRNSLDRYASGEDVTAPSQPNEASAPRQATSAGQYSSQPRSRRASLVSTMAGS
jgi:hypothetical protein